MVFSGNWATPGAAQGDHELVTYNSAYWTITDNFVYNSGNNTTTFSAYADGGYQGQFIALDYKLYGGPAPVPIPSALLLFGPGLVGLGAIRRRFKK